MAGVSRGGTTGRFSTVSSGSSGRAPPWRDLPERYGKWQTVYDRFVRWQRDGTWDRPLTHVQTKSDAVGEVVWDVSIDRTSIRAHQHAAGARRQRSQADEKRGRRTRRTRRWVGAGVA